MVQSFLFSDHFPIEKTFAFFSFADLFTQGCNRSFSGSNKKGKKKKNLKKIERTKKEERMKTSLNIWWTSEWNETRSKRVSYLSSQYYDIKIQFESTKPLTFMHNFGIMLIKHWSQQSACWIILLTSKVTQDKSFIYTKKLNKI